MRYFSFGPVLLTTTTTTNLFNPPSLTGGVNVGGATVVYAILRRLRALNKSGADVTLSLWKGATGANAAGTEFIWSGSKVTTAAPNWLDWYGQQRFDTADFLVGGASANTAILLVGEGELYVY